MKGSSTRGNSDGTIVTRTVCAVLFVAFTFMWLFAFQADLLAVAQHGLSGGKTHYDRTVGAVITTVALYGLQLLVYALTRLSRRTHALTYVPSMLVLAFVTSISYPFSWKAWPWGGPLLLVAWGAAVWAARKAQTMSTYQLPTGLFSRQTWMNVAMMIAMMIGVVAVSNTRAIDHFKAHAEVALMEGDADEALKVGRRSHETDEDLTMLRILALSQKGELGERLFDYAIKGSSSDMLPLPGSRSRLRLMDDSVVWRHFGVSPDTIVAPTDSAHRSRLLTVSQYLDSLQHDTTATTAYRDYRLAGMLIDRKLEAFVEALPHYYALHADSLPRHYREALTLYRQTTDSLFDYVDTLMTSRWHDFHQYDTIFPLKTERRVRTIDDFGTTYWYYYFGVN